MIFVRELEVWGYPGSKLSIEEGDRLVAEIGNELNFPETVLIPHHSTPYETDVENLSICLSEGELTLDAFAHFCSRQNLAVDIKDIRAASEFLTYSYGQKLAWLHLPAERDTDQYLATISQKLQQHSCSLIDPESLACLVP